MRLGRIGDFAEQPLQPRDADHEPFGRSQRPLAMSAASRRGADVRAGKVA